MATMLEAAEPGLEVELAIVRTSGDERPAGPEGAELVSPTPAEAGDKSRFVKEIEQTLLSGGADLAVHSAKDVPGELPEGLAIVGVPARADARDAICGAASVEVLEPGARIGTSSLRRRAQLLAARADLDVRELRGNVDTRLERLGAGDYDAVVLALAGLERLGRADGEAVHAQTMVPAPGQGCLVLEAQAEDERTAALAERLTDRRALVCLTAERAVTTALEATCRTPIGVHAVLGDGAGELAIETFVGLPDGREWIRDRVEGEAERPSALGALAADRLLAAGAAALLEEAERAGAVLGVSGGTAGER